MSSPEIVAYLEFRYPGDVGLSGSARRTLHARAWQPTSDTLHRSRFSIDIYYWNWADLLVTHARRACSTASRVRLSLSSTMRSSAISQGKNFLSGPLSIADLALFPHMESAKAIEVEISPKTRIPI